MGDFYGTGIEIWAGYGPVWQLLRPVFSFFHGQKRLGGPKMSTFCQRSYHRKCQQRWVGGQKKLKSCQRSL